MYARLIELERARGIEFSRLAAEIGFAADDRIGIFQRGRVQELLQAGKRDLREFQATIKGRIGALGVVDGPGFAFELNELCSFAGQMRRGPAQTRYYLEIPATDIAADWPEQRVRSELTARLGIGTPLDAPLGEMGILDLRVRVVEPMQQDLLFVAGDAAHLITPAGGKGMNLAIQDGIELAHGLIERFGPGQDDTRLSAYSRTRLSSIWQTEAFSSWFLHVLLTSLRDGEEPSAVVPGGFSHGLRHGWDLRFAGQPALRTLVRPRLRGRGP